MAAKIRSEYEIGLRDDTGRGLASISAGFNKLSGLVGSLGLGAAAGAAGLVAAVKSSVDYADSLSKASHWQQAHHQIPYGTHHPACWKVSALA